MRHQTIVRLGGALAGALLLACSPGGEPAARVEGDALRLEVGLDPATPRQGENRMELRVLDAEGRPVPDAEVDVKVTMPAMGAMPAMGGPARVEPLGEGRYAADFQLAMDGNWRVDVRASAADRGTLEADGSLITGQTGLRLAAVGGKGPAGSGDESRPTPGSHAGHAAMDSHPGEVYVEPARRQKIGVRVAPVAREPFGVTVRAVGIVGYDQGALYDVAPRIGGYVGDVRVPAPGDTVARGDLLFTLYSPELYAAQKEYLTALASERAGTAAAAPRGGALVRAAEARLRLWGMAASDIAGVAASGAPLEYVPFRAPASGVVIEKSVVEGSGTRAGDRLYRIAAIDRVWIEAELYEADLALFGSGAPATITLPYLPGERFEGTVSLVTPYLDQGTRSARARIELGNPGHGLLPGMYATVALRRDLGERVVVPASAVLYAGERRFVFLDVGEGRLRPQAIETGLRDGERLEVLSGLEPGQSIVVSGNYLIASESRLGSALEQW